MKRLLKFVVFRIYFRSPRTPNLETHDTDTRPRILA